MYQEKRTASAAAGAMKDGRCCRCCMHSRPLHGSEQARLICANRSGYRGVWYLVGDDESCARFRQAVDVPVLPPGARAIPLTQGKYAMVDKADYPDLIRYSWCANRNRSGYQGRRETFYAVRTIKGGRSIRMHRQVMAPKPGQVVDHINHNGLDNRRCNLRLCSKAENARNQRGWSGRSSRYKGVSYHRGSAKWRAAITYKGRQHTLGQFDSETDAARAYNEKARELFKEFACLNDV